MFLSMVILPEQIMVIPTPLISSSLRLSVRISSKPVVWSWPREKWEALGRCVATSFCIKCEGPMAHGPAVPSCTNSWIECCNVLRCTEDSSQFCRSQHVKWAGISRNFDSGLVAWLSSSYAKTRRSHCHIALTAPPQAQADGHSRWVIQPRAPSAPNQLATCMPSRACRPQLQHNNGGQSGQLLVK